MSTEKKRGAWSDIPLRLSAWIMWLGVPLILLAVVLVELGFSTWLNSDPSLHLALLVALLLAVFQTISSNHEHVTVALENARQEMRSLRLHVKDETGLIQWEEAVLELQEALRGVRPGEDIAIDHFGLDMTFAWRNAEELIKRMRAAASLEYRILLLSDRKSAAAHPHRDIRKWMADGRAQREFISERAPELEEALSASGGRLQLDVREYADLPVIHGIRVRRPFDIAYVAICRWGEAGDYDWAGNEYHRVRPATATPARNDLLTLFERNFEHYWLVAADPQRALGPGRSP